MITKKGDDKKNPWKKPLIAAGIAAAGAAGAIGGAELHRHRVDAAHQQGFQEGIKAGIKQEREVVEKSKQEADLKALKEANVEVPSTRPTQEAALKVPKKIKPRRATPRPDDGYGPRKGGL